MKIEYRKADITDAELLIDIYNFAFYSDYIRISTFLQETQPTGSPLYKIINFGYSIIDFSIISLVFPYAGHSPYLI